MANILYTLLGVYLFMGVVTTLWYGALLLKQTKGVLGIPWYLWFVVFVLWPLMICYLIFFKMLNAFLNGARGY